ncbi:hypothetical protein L9F63_015987 [Diploptera punctata]|uniref:WD repeat and HMG-box DNA-binding protein 1 n=1 Tax=Diploptera punctata TaxID=6984 RepID=A0AAD8EI39_DIPPU|nr:hypothetical protein L9F63_015987 [Diploptera punctata]
MSAKKRPMRFAHSEGHTSVCYSDDGKYILTCGTDGDVRIWAGLEDDDPTPQCAGEQVLTVALKGDHYYVGTDNNNVQAYTFPGSDRDGIVSRFTAPVTHLDISSDGTKIAAGSSDMEVHVTDIKTLNTVVLTGHKAPILGVSLDPKHKYMVSSSCDGTICVWSLENKQIVKTWDYLPKCNDFFAAKCLGRTSWIPNTGSILAVPRGKEIEIYERYTWNKVSSHSAEQVTYDFSITMFSPCGKYLAASSAGGDICVWRTNEESCMTYVRHDRGFTICGLAWNPSGNKEIAYCDIMGQLGTVEDCVPALEHTEKPPTAQETQISHIFAELSHIEDIDKLSNVVTSSDDDLESKMSVIEKITPAVDLQPPFQPSSTPVHLQHRFHGHYLVWNSVGIVRCYNTEQDNSIDVEFHDTSLHHALHINNYLKHTMATLTEQVLVLACEVQEETPSKVVCVLLNAWDGSKEWSVDLPEGEEALAVAAAQGWVAVATDTRYLRLFTVTGTQREVVSLPGPIVCVCGYKNRLLAVYHSGMGLPGDQNLGFVVLSVGSGPLQAVTTFQPVAMTPKCTLKWAGFSDEGTPFTVDSAGIVRMFCRKGYWMPVCDTQTHSKGKSDHYFVIGISEKYQNIRCVLCKGSYYPPTTPRPALKKLPVLLPLCDMTAEKTILEEKFWRSQISCTTFEDVCKNEIGFYAHKDSLERTLKETIIKLFALACRGGQEYRAVEMCNLMPSHHVAQLAMKYASKLGKMHLADKVSEVVTLKMEESSLRLNVQEEDYSTKSTWDKSETSALHFKNNSQTDENDDDNRTHMNGHRESDIIESTDGESLLAAAKKRRSESRVEIKPILSSQRRLNPFKKSLSKLDTGRALENLSTSYAEQSNKNKNSTTSSEPTPRPLDAKQTKLLATKLTESTKKVPTFIEWFEKEKESLQEEFPELAEKELSRQATKRYKELMKNNKLVPLVDSQDVSLSLNDTVDSEASTCDTTVLETTRSEEPEVSTPTTANMKRKLDQVSTSEKEVPAKKISASSSSKLMSFMFKKS